MEVPGYEGIYYIEPNGNVYSMDKIVKCKDGKIRFYEGKLIKSSDNGNGYYYVNLRENGNQKNYLVHRLVALTYLDNPNNYPCVNHKDCNPQNNDLNNLEWCTQEYNNQSINKTINFGGVYYNKDGKKCYVARYTIYKVHHSKSFNTDEEARTWLENEKNNIINKLFN